jgi:hypothetical protein
MASFSACTPPSTPKYYWAGSGYTCEEGYKENVDCHCDDPKHPICPNNCPDPMYGIVQCSESGDYCKEYKSTDGVNYIYKYGLYKCG